MCRFCDQARQFARRTWHRFQPTPRCIVSGCKTQSASHLCKQHFAALPLAMRQRWWRETGYSTRAPSPQLADDINRALAAKP